MTHVPFRSKILLFEARPAAPSVPFTLSERIALTPLKSHRYLQSQHYLTQGLSTPLRRGLIPFEMTLPPKLRSIAASTDFSGAVYVSFSGVPVLLGPVPARYFPFQG